MHKPIELSFNLQTLMRQNIRWTIIATAAVIVTNRLIQTPEINWSFWSIITSISLFFIYYVVLIVLHEICHLIGFIIFGRAPIASISYGLKLKDGVAYATTSAKLTNRAMKASLLLPFWVTGVIPTLLGFYWNSYTLLIVGAFLMAGAVGDFMMYNALRKFPNNALVEDDAHEPKLYVYEIKKDSTAN